MLTVLKVPPAMCAYSRYPVMASWSCVNRQLQGSRHKACNTAPPQRREQHFLVVRYLGTEVTWDSQLSNPC